MVSWKKNIQSFSKIEEEKKTPTNGSPEEKNAKLRENKCKRIEYSEYIQYANTHTVAIKQNSFEIIPSFSPFLILFADYHYLWRYTTNNAAQLHTVFHSQFFSFFSRWISTNKCKKKTEKNFKCENFVEALLFAE